MIAFETSSTFAKLLELIDSWSQLAPVAFLVRLITGLLIVAVGKVLLIWLAKLLKRTLARARKVNDLMARFLLQLLNIVGWIFLAVAFLQHLGLNMGPVLAGLGITGVILGFAFQETLGNLLSGVMIVINAPFRIGDYIETGSFGGTVTDMDLICITLSTPDNKKITMSNKLVWGNPIVNYSNIERRRVELTVSVPYGTDVQKAREVMLNIISSYPEVLPDPAPVVEVHKLSQSSIDFTVRPWTRPADYWKTYWRFNAEVTKQLAEAGIPVAYNKLEVNVKSST